MGVFFKLLGRLFLAIIATYLGGLVFELLDAYFLDSNNLTHFSYYFETSLWGVPYLSYTFIYSVWGIPLIALQFFLYFLLLRSAPFKLHLLFCISSLQALLNFLNYNASDLRRISCFLLALVVIWILFFVLRWIIVRRQKKISATSLPDSPPNAMWACILIGLLICYFLYIYIAIYWPNKQLSDLHILEKDPVRTRNICHQVLSHYIGDHHDAFIIISHVSTEESVPYLINALRWQPETKPTDAGMIDTKAICLQDLSALTNQRPGLNYSDWVKWWKINKTKSRREWVLDGFRQHGLPVTDPPDNKFIDSLISAVGSKRFHWVALQWFLSQVPKDQLLGALDSASKSSLGQDRVGVINCLLMMRWPEAESKIALFLQDSDLAVSKSAASAMKILARSKKNSSPIDKK